MGAKRTIRVSQKQVERFTFMLIIFILLGLLIKSEAGSTCDNSTVSYVAKYGIDELKPHNIPVNSDVDLDTENNYGSFLDGIDDSSGENNQTSDNSTSLNETDASQKSNNDEPIYDDRAYLTIGEIKYEKIDDSKAKILSFVYRVNNSYKYSNDYTINYYIYDKSSHPSEELEPKKPLVQTGSIRAGQSLSNIFDVDKYVFNLEYTKTFKFELVNSDNKIEEQVLKQVLIE